MIKIINASTEIEVGAMESCTYTEDRMGGESITGTIMYPIESIPPFSLEWYIIFENKKFFLQDINPDGVKDNTGRFYKYTLPFKSKYYELENVEFLNFIDENDLERGHKDHTFSFVGDLREFVIRYNLNLQYYFGDNWEMAINPKLSESERNLISVERASLWDVLAFLYPNYEATWTIEYGDDKNIINVGYDVDEVSHVFQYNSEGGLYKFQRSKQNDEVITRLRGLGSTTNVPYRYFKQSLEQGNVEWMGDPDWISELETDYIPNLLMKPFRSYVRGWKDAKEGLPKKTTQVDEIGGLIADVDYNKGYDEQKAGSKFNPTDYVESPNIDVWGERYGRLEDNELIYPTIQGAYNDEVGRIDAIVDVEEVINDDWGAEIVNPDPVEFNIPDITVTSVTKINAMIPDSIGGNYGPRQYSYITATALSDPITIVNDVDNYLEFKFFEEYGVRGDKDIYDITNSGFRIFLRPATIDSTGNYVVSDASPVQFYEHDTPDNQPISSPRLVTFRNTPPGTYILQVSYLRWYTAIWRSYAAEYDLVNRLQVSSIKYVESKYVQTGPDENFSKTFDVWIKDIGFNLADPIYWAGEDMYLHFSSGYLSGYEFKVVGEKLPDGRIDPWIVEDDSKSIEVTLRDGTVKTVKSKYKITLEKSDAEINTNGLYLPSINRNASPGDFIFFTGIQMPHVYTLYAEKELYDIVKTELAEVDDKFLAYSVDVYDTFLVDFPEKDKIHAGSRLRVRNSALVPDTDGYISQYISSRQISNYRGEGHPYNIQLTLSDKLVDTESVISKIQGELQSIRAGGAYSQQIVSEVVRTQEGLFLRSDGVPDTSYSPTTFEQNVTIDGDLVFGSKIVSADFVQGSTIGSGFGVYKDGDNDSVLEVDKVIVRKDIKANEFIVEQARAISGEHWITAANMECNQVSHIASRNLVSNSDGQSSPVVPSDGTPSGWYSVGSTASISTQTEGITFSGPGWVVMRTPVAGTSLGKYTLSIKVNRIENFNLGLTIALARGASYNYFGIHSIPVDQLAVGGTYSFTTTIDDASVTPYFVIATAAGNLLDSSVISVAVQMESGEVATDVVAKEVGNIYRCYLDTYDGKVLNDFIVGDQAYSRKVKNVNDIVSRNLVANSNGHYSANFPGTGTPTGWTLRRPGAQYATYSSKQEGISWTSYGLETVGLSQVINNLSSGKYTLSFTVTELTNWNPACQILVGVDSGGGGVWLGYSRFTVEQGGTYSVTVDYDSETYPTARFSILETTAIGNPNQTISFVCQMEPGEVATAIVPKEINDLPPVRYYWGVVKGVGPNYIDIDWEDVDANTTPEVGDNIIQLGNRTDVSRQSALRIDQTNPETITQLGYIDSFSLTGKNYIGQGFNQETKDPYWYCYGDAFIGDRDLSDPSSTFLTYQRREGDDKKKLFIKAAVEFTSDSTGLGNLSEFKDVIDRVEEVDRDAQEASGKADEALQAADAAKDDAVIAQKAAEDAQKAADEARRIADEADQISTENKNYIDNILSEELANLQDQIDGVIISHFYDYDPTNDNYPANEWTTDALKEQHEGDTFTNTMTGISYRWLNVDGVWGWVIISDTLVAEALRLAGEAKDTADSKRRVFVSTPYTPYEIGDLWTQSDQPLMRCAMDRLTGSYLSSDWVLADNTQELIDEAERLAEEARIAAEEAKGDAASAKDVADSKPMVFTSVEDPALSGPVKNGDIWAAEGSQLTRVYYAGTGWIIIGDDTGTRIDNGLVTTGTLVAGYRKDEEDGEFSGLAGITGADPDNDQAVRIWAGSENKDVAPFRVSQSGGVVANDAQIVGRIMSNNDANGTSVIIDPAERKLKLTQIDERDWFYNTIDILASDVMQVYKLTPLEPIPFERLPNIGEDLNFTASWRNETLNTILTNVSCVLTARRININTLGYTFILYFSNNVTFVQTTFMTIDAFYKSGDRTFIDLTVADNGGIITVKDDNGRSSIITHYMNEISGDTGTNFTTCDTISLSGRTGQNIYFNASSGVNLIVRLVGLPTTRPSAPNLIWNDNGTLKIS